MFCGVRVNLEHLVGVILVEFRNRVSEMAIGTAKKEWLEFRDVDLENRPVLLVDDEECVWITTSD